MKIACLFPFAIVTLGFSVSQQVLAGSGTWLLNPVDNDWNTAANWSSGSVPNGFDTATFGVSNTTDISMSGGAQICCLTFNPGASAYSFAPAPGFRVDFTGGGIVNDSGIEQNFLAKVDGSGLRSSFDFGGSAGRLATFTTEARTAATGSSGSVSFSHDSDAGEAVFHNLGATVSGGAGGRTDFFYNASAASCTVINDGATVAGATGGATSFQIGFPNGANATFIANGGSNGGGGGSYTFTDGTGGTARFQLFGNGYLDISRVRAQHVAIGSLEGDGQVYLGNKILLVGTNSLSTLFAGVLHPTKPFGHGKIGGTLTKTGSGTLTLTGANLHTDGTVVEEGALMVRNTTGSGTGTGPVQIDSGTFGGSGIIKGTVTIGNGGGVGAFLTPSIAASQPTSLTIKSAITFKADGTYSCKLNAKKARADQIIANGVTIESGAQFDFDAVANEAITPGTIFIVINNTSGTPIGGTFANLADDSTFRGGSNDFQVSYSGNDGNDLTLTALP